MTDTVSARERIRAVLEEAYYEGIYSEHNGGPEHVFDESWVGTIIDIVREALITDGALVALCTTREYVKYSGEGNGWREGMEAALDAAFGDQQP